MSFIYVWWLDEFNRVMILIVAWKLKGAEATILKIFGTGTLEDW